ncbi:hypothetical protein Pmar_PMAR028627 [Perkinsus marinus ATCC 50983]|uniref:RSE1/DDB1/CPSF1 C-terminal domain-containing protein n=1 Tax=Perkinsus marinus (strain ATCC 50983 / TXsc) TaxID=423536 RepID=C5K8F4_PERM5|nr:hypothetical protein Pmar_PMAR028627 [Perkinsus marinus ATCC 50983]EER19161.1 hypothetical protein Pmar_PMAR028627 [Perkinsus marinus ATCC 50983]|eukprot:XP_002787365.1 hypothetical protein Pmar_PMAR028627 [Perkinsus marinus ATCC 50983]
MPPKDGENKRCVNIAASQNEYPKIDVSERRVRRILALSWQEIVAIGPRTISRYGMAQADDGEVRSDYITTKLMRRVCVGGTIGRLFIVDDEGWLHVLHRSASGGSGSRHYVDDGKRKGNAGKRRRETKVRGDLSGRDGMEMEPEPYLDTASYVRTIHAELSLSPILDFQLPANTGRDLLMVTGRSEASSMWFEDEGVGECRVAECVDDVEYWTAKRIVSFVTLDFSDVFIDEPSIWCGGVSNLVVQVSKGAVRWVDVSSSPPVLVRSDEVENGRSFVAATGDGDTVVTVDDCGRAWIRQMKDRGRVETTEVSFGKSLVGVSCVAYDSSSSMLAVGLWPSVGEESSQGKLMLKEIGNRKGRGRFRTPLEIPLGSSRVESSVTRSIVVTSRRSLGMSSAAEVIDVGGFRPISLSKLPSINGLFVRGTYPYLLTADDEGAELMCRNVNPLQGGVAVECAVEFGEERAFAMSAGQKDSHVAVMALMTSQPSLVFASLSTDEPCEFQTRRRAVGEGQAAMHVEHVTGDMYAVSTITIEERLNEDKGKENTSDNNNRRGASSSSSVRLMNGSSLREIYCIPAEEDVDMPADDDEEEEESTVEVVSLATFNLGDAEDSGIVYLCVGSCVVPAMAGRSETDEAEPSKGFVKVYRIDPTASLLSGSKAEVCEQVATVEVEGVPYQMASMVDAENPRYEFPLWPTAIQFLSNGNILVADDRFNLFIMEKQKEIGGSHSDSRGYSLQTVGQLHLGLLVNCIRPGMLSSTMPPSSRGSNGEHRDEYLLCTIEGAVVSLKGIDDTGIGRMLQIQHAIAVNIHQQSSGSPSVDARVDWKLFRSIDSSTLPSSGGALDPSGFVDGDLLELFLVMADELAVKTANTLCDGTEADELVKEVRGIVDSFA